MVAAESASRLGLSAMVIDDAPIRDTVPPEGVGVAFGVSVLAITADREILWSGHGSSGTFHAERIILATGSTPRAIPFPGWTRPGVVFASGLEALDLRPGQRAIVAGTASNLQATARRLESEGVEVLAIVDAGDPDPNEPGAPVFRNHAVFEADGEDCLQSVTFGPVDPSTWLPDRSRRRTLGAGWLVLDFGDAPRDELAVLAGCKMEFDPVSGGARPIHDALGQTTIPCLFWANGSDDAGRLAGITAAEDAGRVPREQAEADREPILSRLKARVEPSPLHPGLFALPTAETILCRCECVPLSTMQKAVDEGARDLTTLKLATRLGMGACQGRECGIAVSWMLARLTRQTPGSVGRINPRPPARTVTLGSLARMSRGVAPPMVFGEAP